MHIFMSSSSGNLNTTTGFICFKGTHHKDENNRKGDSSHEMWKLGSSRTGVTDSEDPGKLSSSRQLLDPSNHPAEDRGGPPPPPPASSGTGGAEQFCGGWGQEDSGKRIGSAGMRSPPQKTRCFFLKKVKEGFEESWSWRIMKRRVNEAKWADPTTPRVPQQSSSAGSPYSSKDHSQQPLPSAPPHTEFLISFSTSSLSMCTRRRITGQLRKTFTMKDIPEQTKRKRKQSPKTNYGALMTISKRWLLISSERWGDTESIKNMFLLKQRQKTRKTKTALRN